MPKWCKVCRVQYVVRCRNEKHHDVIREWYAERDAIRSIKDLLLEAIDDARKLDRKWRPRAKRKIKRTTQTLTLGA